MRELPRAVDPVADVLARIGRKGVKLWVVNGQLHYRAVKGSLTDEEREIIRCHKDQIVSMLERTASVAFVEPNASSPSHPEPAALSLSQEAHWRRYKLQSHNVFRTVASATRIVGRVDLDRFRDSIKLVVRRHPGLRTRIIVRDDTPMQEISESIDFKFELHDLTTLPPMNHEFEVKRLIEELILKPIKASEGPLWEARLLRLRNDEHVLVVVMEHIISDMRSLQILLRDVFSIYAQISQGHSVSLPVIPMQFVEYAEWQHRSFTNGRSSYWTNHLSQCQRVKFPDDHDLLTNLHRGWSHIHITITSQRRQSLSIWSRSRKTTISMAVLTAYAALVTRWCNVSDVVINYVIDGRTSDKVRDTIGYFAKLLPIRVELHRTDNFVSLLKRVTTEYYKSYEQSGSYDLDAQIPVPEFASNSQFNWITQDNESPADQNLTEAGLRCLPMSFEPPIPETVEMDVEPFILLSDSGREVSGGIYFPRNRFSLAKMQKFASNFSGFIEALAEKSEEPVYEIPLS